MLRQIAETKEIALKLIEKGRNLTEAGQSALDLATNIWDLATTEPSFFRDPMFPYVLGGLHELTDLAESKTSK